MVSKGGHDDLKRPLIIDFLDKSASLNNTSYCQQGKIHIIYLITFVCEHTNARILHSGGIENK